MGMYVFNPLIVFSHENDLITYDIARTMGYNGEFGEDKKLLNFYRKCDLTKFITSKWEKSRNQVNKNLVISFTCGV